MSLSISSTNGVRLTQLRDYRKYVGLKCVSELDEQVFVTARVISVSGLKVGFILFVCFLRKVCFICENVFVFGCCSDLRGREIKKAKVCKSRSK